MYKLHPHIEQDPAEMLALMKKHPFATVIGSDADGNPVATQVPLLIREEGNEIRLLGHIMRKTDHHLAFENNPRVLALFSSPTCYVSPSWYSNQQTGGTWNYMTVHARGTVRFTGEAELIEILRDTQNFFEGNPASPSNFENLSDSYVNPLAKAIIGLDIKVTKLEGVFKLSQNRDEASFNNIIHHLKQGSHDAQYIASAMERRASQLFKKNTDA